MGTEILPSFYFCLGVTRCVVWAVVSVKQIKGDAGNSSSSAGDVSFQIENLTPSVVCW